MSGRVVRRPNWPSARRPRPPQHDWSRRAHDWAGCRERHRRVRRSRRAGGPRRDMHGDQHARRGERREPAQRCSAAGSVGSVRAVRPRSRLSLSSCLARHHGTTHAWHAGQCGRALLCPSCAVPVPRPTLAPAPDCSGHHTPALPHDMACTAPRPASAGAHRRAPSAERCAQRRLGRWAWQSHAPARGDLRAPGLPGVLA